MSKTEAPLDAIRRYIPDDAAQLVLDYLNLHKVHLTITRERKSVLGDYRHATTYNNPRFLYFTVRHYRTSQLKLFFVSFHLVDWTEQVQFACGHFNTLVSLTQFFSLSEQFSLSGIK